MIDQLKEDLASVISRMPSSELTTSADLRKFLVDEMLPFIGTLVDEIAEQGDDIATLAEQSDDILHSESAAVFAAIIVTGRVLMSELKKRAGKDATLIAQVGAWMGLATQGEKLLEEITLEDSEDGDEDEAPEDPETPQAADDDDEGENE